MNNSTKKANPKINHRRTLSRLMAAQIFYQFSFFNQQKELEDIKNDVIDNYILDSGDNIESYRKKIDETFLNNLLLGLSMNLTEIDKKITEFLKEEWNINSINDILLQILRLGSFELKFISDIPAKVIIDEYVDISASFFDDKIITFANATLDAIAKNLRKEEFEK